jgi:hypothetical protein
VILLDLNKPEFQSNRLTQEKQEAWAVLKTLRVSRCGRRQRATRA